MNGNSNSTAIRVLNDLIETCKDGEYGFRICAEQAESAELKTQLRQRSQECADAVAQLQNQVFALGGSPDNSGSLGGALHRGWVSLKTTLAGFDDLAVMEEAERGEDAALDRYRDALEVSLQAPIRALVEQQYERVQRSHRMMREQRDALQT